MTANASANAASVARGVGSSRSRALWLVALLIALGALCAASIAIGTRDVAWDDIAGALAGRTDSIAQAAVTVRIPRTLLAVLAGASLAVAGLVLQGVTRNPLGDPGILGINMGASLAVVIGVAWFGIASSEAYIWTAILGAGSSGVFIYTIASLGRGGPTPLKLALAGAATSIAFSSLVVAVMMTRGDISTGLHSWQIGGVGGATFERMGHVIPFLAVGFIISLACSRKLNALALGDEMAAGLGENVAWTRGLAAFGAIVLCGATTAICGPITFVGLIIPHLCRLLVGIDHRWLLPFSAITGACLLLVADILGRIIARPSELDVGIVTAFVGAPFFIWVVRRQRIRDL
jgi:iron complex transport system permease protein